MLGVLKKTIPTYIFLVFIFLLSLYIACSIPSSYLKKSIVSSIPNIEKEGTYPSRGLPFRKIVLDNYTDTLMLNTAYTVNSTTPLKSALTNLRFHTDSNGTNQILDLKSSINNSVGEFVGYERYWHGYLLYLRPLLVIFTFQQIRNLMYIFLVSLVICFLYFVYKKFKTGYTFAFGFGLFVSDILSTQGSLQFSIVFLISLIASIYLLQRTINRSILYLFFFIVGAVTVFFDLLTAPLVTLGLPLIISHLQDKKSSIKSLIYFCIMWGLGYTLMWATKWGTAQMLYTPTAISTALSEITHRTVSQADANFSQINAIKLNFFQLIGYDRISKLMTILIGILATLLMIFFNKISTKYLKNILPLIFIGALPYTWYLVIANHSYIHVWYTYRIQMISVISYALIFIQLIDWNSFKSFIKYRKY